MISSEANISDGDCGGGGGGGRQENRQTEALTGYGVTCSLPL